MGFSPTLEFKCIELNSPEKILRLSSFVQESICYLDLSPNRKAWFDYDILTTSGWKCFGLGNLRIVNTEEKCRKIFAPQRHLLDTLHLDLPKGRENSLKEDIPKSGRIRYYYTGPHIGLIIPVPGFHARLLPNFVRYAINSNEPNLRLFKWLVKLASSEEPFLGEPLTLYLHRFFRCFYPVIEDVELFKAFIMHAPIGDWIAYDIDTEHIEYLLRHARRFGRRDLDKGVGSLEANLGICFENRFENLGPLLKFMSFPRFTSGDYRWWYSRVASVSPDLTADVLTIEEILTKPRLKHMLQIIWMYIDGFDRPLEEGLEALRLLWSSFPDPCISFEELRTAFGRVYSETELQNIYGFYKTAVGEDANHEYANPRSLKHLGKCALRSVFQENGIWIPDGIEQLKLGHLRSFLNLEREYVPDIGRDVDMN